MRRAAAIAGLTVVLGAAATAATAATAGTQVVVTDPKGDVTASKLDIVRGSLELASDGKLRATVTFARAVTDDDLGATGTESVPGGVCLRLWSEGQSPSAQAPDHLVCADADGGSLRGSVLRERPADLPVRTARAAVRRTSTRTLVIRFAQTAVGHPARVRFGLESTRPGCPRTSCIDTAPNAPRSAVLVIR